VTGTGARQASPDPGQILTDARDAWVKLWSTMHEAAFRVTEGRICNRLLGMPVVELTTTGRRTGQPRSVMLTAPLAEPGRIVLVASNAADRRDPQWYANLSAHPEVAVTRDGTTRAMRARVAAPDERAELWDRIRAVTPIYEVYQRRTNREIPVVVLEASGG